MADGLGRVAALEQRCRQRMPGVGGLRCRDSQMGDRGVDAAGLAKIHGQVLVRAPVRPAID